MSGSFSSLFGHPLIKEEKALDTNASFEKEYKGTAEFKKSLAIFVNLKDYDGRTALHVAALNNNFEATKTLLRYNANIFIRDYKDQVSYLLNMPL